MKIKNILFATGLAITGLFTTSSHAAPIYAVSYTNISDFGISTTSGTASVSGFSFSNSTVLNNSGDVASSADFGSTSDAGSSCIGNCSTFNNEFSSHTESGFIYADALVGSTNINGNTGAASAIAEANISSGWATAAASNSFTGGLINIGSGGADISFSFLLDEYLEVSGDGIGTAWSSFGLTIDNLIAPALSPTGYNIGPISSGSASFSDIITTDSIHLTEGTHSISIAMNNNINLTTVPVPAAVWLFGSGLIGLASIAKRKTRT